MLGQRAQEFLAPNPLANVYKYKEFFCDFILCNLDELFLRHFATSLFEHKTLSCM